VSEGFRHCFERDVTEGRSMSWYIDLDEGNLEDEITLGPIRNVDCRRARKHSRTPPPDRDRTGSSHSRKASSSSCRRTAKRDRSRSKLQRIVTSLISGQPERIRVLGLGIAGANGRTISGNISSRIATGLGNRETYASRLPSVDLARQEPSNYG
jgi:hypothetical protein